MTLVVNGEKIEDSLIQQEAERLRPSYEQTFKDMDPKERETQLLDWSKENVIERVLINQEKKWRPHTTKPNRCCFGGIEKNL